MFRGAVRLDSGRARASVGAAGSLANDSLQIDRSYDSRGRQLIEIQKTEKIQRKAPRQDQSICSLSLPWGGVGATRPTD